MDPDVRQDDRGDKPASGCASPPRPYMGAMSSPISVDVPHQLGAAEAKRRIGDNIGSLGAHLPAGAQVRSAWQGDTLQLGIGVLGQQVEAEMAVQERLIRVSVKLPPALAFFGKAIEGALRHSVPELLEDRSRR